MKKTIKFFIAAILAAVIMLPLHGAEDPVWGCDSTSNYSANIIISNLENGYPVVCSAIRMDRGEHGHAFLIDSYKRCRIKTITYYEWVYDDPGAGGHNPVPLLREITYGFPYIKYYRMNWGMWDTGPNDTWCSLNGVWQYSTYPPYIYNQKKLYDFTLL